MRTTETSSLLQVFATHNLSSQHPIRNLFQCLLLLFFSMLAACSQSTSYMRILQNSEGYDTHSHTVQRSFTACKKGQNQNPPISILEQNWDNKQNLWQGSPGLAVAFTEPFCLAAQEICADLQICSPAILKGEA